MPRELTHTEIENVTKALTTEDSSSFISAVKLYRKYSGMGLKECKAVVDDMVAELQRLEPEKYSHLSKRGRGCMAFLVLLLVITSLVVAGGTGERTPEVTHWNQEIAGTYTGTLFASGYDMPVVTTFYFENQALYGEYVMDEDGTMSPGQLTDIMFTQGHTIECRWIDRYGTGSASFTFTADVSGFAGFWNTDEGTDEYTWWGSKHSMDAEEQNSGDL